MRRASFLRWCLPWFAALLQVWLPVAGYAAMARSGELVEICTPRGIERVAPDAIGLPDGGRKSTTTAHQDHCPLCSAPPGVGSVAIEVAGLAVVAVAPAVAASPVHPAGLQCRLPASTGPPSFS